MVFECIECKILIYLSIDFLVAYVKELNEGFVNYKLYLFSKNIEY